MAMRGRPGRRERGRLQLTPGIKRAKQARSQATHDAILEASLEVIGEWGPDDFALSDVVARARCTTGAVYARFRDKEGLLLALYEHVTEQWKQGLRAAFAEWGKRDLSLEAELRAFIGAQIKVRRRDWMLRNAFLTRILRQPAFRAQSASVIRTMAELMVEALVRRRGFRSVSREDLKRRAGLASVMIGASLERAITLRPDAADCLPADDDALAGALSTAVAALLGGS